jgi:hypothetical protein
MVSALVLLWISTTGFLLQRTGALPSDSAPWIPALGILGAGVYACGLDIFVRYNPKGTTKRRMASALACHLAVVLLAMTAVVSLRIWLGSNDVDGYVAYGWWFTLLALLPVIYLYRFGESRLLWSAGDEVIRSRALALVFYILGTWLFVFGIVTWYVPYGRPRRVWRYAAEAFKKSRQHWTGAVWLVKPDRRLPVVYLRPFIDDALTAAGVDFEFKGIGLFTEEEQMAMVLGRVGPFLAVGRPGQSLPDAGAKRLYLSNEEWQAKVTELIQGARLVVLRPGSGEGIAWEAGTVLAHLSPEQLIILVPADSKQYEEFRAKLAKSLSHSLPPHPGDGHFGAASLSGFLEFGDGWKAQFHRFDSRHSVFALTSPLAPIFARAFRPVFERLGVSGRAWGMGWPRKILIAAPILLYLCLLFRRSVHSFEEFLGLLVWFAVYTVIVGMARLLSYVRRAGEQ